MKIVLFYALDVSISHTLMKCQEVIDIFSIRQNCQLSRGQSLK